MKLTRRDLLWGVAGTAGLLVTPVPWKLLDDLSIWSQNWPWIPQPAHGPVEVKQSFCTLCPHGCGAHQLNWHPRRLRTVRHRASSSSWEAARVAFAKACSEGPIAIIDG